MREHLSLTSSARRWTAAGVALVTVAATVATLFYTVEHDLGWPATIITLTLMIGFPAVAGVYVARLRREGEHLAADVLLDCVLAGVVSMLVIWGVWGGIGAV